MKTTKSLVTLLALLAIGTMAGCWGHSSQSPDVSGSIRKSLDQAGLKDVSVTQDRDKGIVTLGGQVLNQDAKLQAETLAKSFAAGQVVANEIAVVPVGGGKETSAINSDLDQGIEKNFDAVLIQNKMRDAVKFKVKNGVVTLSGEVNSESTRASVEQLANTVPNVTQVVNDLQVPRNQKASSSQ